MKKFYPVFLMSALIGVAGSLWGCKESIEPIGFVEPVTIGERCEYACGNLYKSCGLFLTHSNGSAVSERVCRERCEDQNEFRGYELCVGESSCRASAEEMVLGCFPEGLQVPHCEHLGLWPQELERIEDEVLEILNQRRAEGANCGTAGNYGPAEPLAMNETLRCAARLHSIDMNERGYFEHDTPEGVSPFERISLAGYTAGGPQGENIARGHGTAEQVMAGWMNSDGHCSNIMEPGFREIGVGFYELYWTQKFGGGR